MSTSKPTDIYHPRYVKAMFDRMSKTYGTVNYIASFGFAARWRKQCVRLLPQLPENAQGFDLMSGMGEAWEDLLPRMGKNGKLTAIDISDQMNARALAHKNRLNAENVTLQKVDVLDNNIPGSSADFVLSCFGIKTFNTTQQQKLAQEVERLLKPGGVFAFVEISDPKSWYLRPLYMFYLKVITPLIGRLFLGNAADYRMLGTYCEAFGDCSSFRSFLQESGLNCRYVPLFFSCATVVIGHKPA